MFYPVQQIYVLISVLSVLLFSTSVVLAEDWHFETEGRVIVASDIHGAYDDFVGLLKGVELIDDELLWKGDEDHLVIVGDVLDRGAKSRDALELIMKLDTQAKAAGGRVHLLLGNHEIMNLVGDLRYVAVEEYARYVDVEKTGARKSGLFRFKNLAENAGQGEATLLERFENEHPPGFFGHAKLFSAKGKFGSWLMTRPAIIKVNDSVFAHGGLSQSMLGKSLESINTEHNVVLRQYLTAREYFINRGVLGTATNFFDQPYIVKKTLAAEVNVEGKTHTNSPQDQEAAKRLFNAYRSAIFADDSPTWYRGNVGCSAAIERDRLHALLESFGAKRLLVGHTPTFSRKIESRFDGMLIKVDTGMLKSRYHGQPSALVISADDISAAYVERPGEHDILTQQRSLGPRPGGINDTELEQTLANASLIGSEPVENKRRRVSLDYEGNPFEALFTIPRSKKKNVTNLPEVAAYRLDRQLGMEMIPVAMLRNIDGDNGAITLSLDNLFDEDQRMARQLGGSAWCPLKDQFNMMYVFDSLLHNKGRERNAMRYVTNDMRLLLTNNRKTLGTDRGIPKYLKAAPILISPGLKTQLRELSPESLEILLGDVLDEKRREAILSRRDILLKKNK